MHDEEANDPLRALTIERVWRSDGRYLIYYSWPRDAERRDDGPPSGDDLADHGV